MIIVVNAAKVGLVAASWVNASVIGDASYGGTGVSANDADKRVRAVGIATSGAHRICAEGQSARNEKSGQRYFDRRTHDNFSFRPFERLNKKCFRATPDRHFRADNRCRT